MTSKRVKYSGIKKEGKDLYGENYEIVMKELKEDTNSKTAPVHGFLRKSDKKDRVFFFCIFSPWMSLYFNLLLDWYLLRIAFS